MGKSKYRYGDNNEYDKESDFYLLKNSPIPAVLTENLFMDHTTDRMELKQGSCQYDIARYHYDAMIAYDKIYK